jgi:hypothetical protein
MFNRLSKSIEFSKEFFLELKLKINSKYSKRFAL